MKKMILLVILNVIHLGFSQQKMKFIIQFHQMEMM